MRTRHTAFTLIELMVVIVIIGLLSAVATASFSSAQRTSRDNARKTEVSSIANAIESYYRDYHTFPGYRTDTDSGFANASSTSCQKKDTDHTVSYSYVPSSASTACTGGLYKSSDTFPTWIPGLGTYMSSAPIDKGFRDNNGITYEKALAGSSVTMTKDVWGACDSCANKTRTYTYRHLSGGYIVYTRLEGASTDTQTAALSGTGVTVLGTSPGTGNVYAIQH